MNVTVVPPVAPPPSINLEVTPEEFLVLSALQYRYHSGTSKERQSLEAGFEAGFAAAFPGKDRTAKLKTIEF